jgi:hypothetical protein
METSKIMYSVRKLLSLSVASLALTFSIAACDGGGGSPLAGDNRVVSSLSAEELKTVCEVGQSIEPSQDEQKAIAKVECTVLLALFGECNPTAVDDCVKEFLSPEGGGNGEEPEACDLGVDAKACNVTVAQLYACSQAQLDALVDAADTVTCQNATSGGGASDEQPASCKIVEQKCPSFLDHDDDSAE